MSGLEGRILTLIKDLEEEKRLADKRAGQLFNKIDYYLDQVVKQASSPTFVKVTLSNGQIVFPAAQVASADPNTLDDYEEGTWTPVITFVNPGNLSVGYAYQNGIYQKIGNTVKVDCLVITSSFTHTTAAGYFQVTGFPFTSLATPIVEPTGGFAFSGITIANYSQFTPILPQNSATAAIYASGSGLANDLIDATHVPTGGTVSLRFSLTYTVP